MGVLVNKSDLKRELISPEILTILEELKKQFIDEQYKLSIKTVDKQPNVKSTLIPINKQVTTQKVTKKIPVTIDDDDDDDSSSVLSSGSSVNSNTSETSQKISPQIISNNTKNENNKNNITDSFDEDDTSNTNELLLEPRIVPVGPKNDTTITINKGKQIIKKWFDNGSKNVELDYILNEMIKKYQDRSAADQIELLLSEMSLTQKYNIIVKSIKIRYPNECDYDTKDMLFGAELWRSYIESFPQTL